MVLHWFADFFCQTEKMALGKSTNLEDLLMHVAAYSGIMSIATLLYVFIADLSEFHAFKLGVGVAITFVFHLFTDYYTSKAHKLLWDNKKTHEFFTSIGFDQLLHYSQLFLTFYFVKP